MSDNILTQEEIDALLTAMDKGEVEFEPEPEETTAGPQAKAYDLTTQRGVLRHQFHALEEVYDKFSSLLDSGISSSLQKNIEVELISSEMVKYGEFIQAYSNPTGFVIFSMEPLIGSGLLAIEPSLVFSMIDCMFGGDGTPIAEIREFTMIERHMAKRFAQEVLKNLEKAWEIVYSVRVAIKKIETKPEYVHLVPPDELMIVFVLSLTGEKFSGNIHLCLSYRMLEPIKDKLSSRYLREKDLEDAFSTQLESLLRDTTVNLVTELGYSKFTIRELLNLETNDVIMLNNGPEDPVVINVEKKPKYEGLPGVLKGNRAVQITRLIQ